MTRLLLPALAALAPLVSAGIKFTSPAAGDKLKAGTAIDIEWEAGGTGPDIADLTTYTLSLVAGGQKPEEQVTIKVITTQGNFAIGGNKASGLIDLGLPGASKPDNAYFVKMVAVGKTGGELTTYSDRFSYSGMTGTWPVTVQKALDDLDVTTGPDTVDGTTEDAANPAADEYDVEYTMQTGPTRYAPMQPVPPTKVTATNTKPMHPTSSYTIATTFLPIPSIQTTITQSQTYSVSSRVNTAAAAPDPTDDMQKFLNRWKD
ncbi:Cell wall synthesis protein kre9 precursor [Neodidymelliopsis sp. IMI 364377]|nr:Cell wall synthesis protein kre9 precursor [Neodidymelliopsis sp. IMI 364377]